jgi:ferric-dicitrate binding protein FerR (iron transport regulator)
MRVGVLLERRAAGLTEAERLVVEEHVAGCPSCAQDARLLTLVTDLAMTAEGALTESARARAIARALRADAPSAAADASPRRSGRRAATLLRAAAAGAAAALFWAQPVQLDAPALAGLGAAARSGVPALPAATAPSVLEGAVLVGGAVVAAGSPLPARGRFVSNEGARVRLDRAVIDLEALSEVSWDPTTHTVSLHGGTVRVDVEPLPGRIFRVAATQFLVEVLGTRFEVGPQHVRVERGRVRVRDTSGDEIAEIAAGGRWELWSEDEDADAVRRPAAVDELLRKARHELATGDVGAARVTLDAAFARRLTGSQRAEAQSLRAECALVEGNDREAARRYERVAEEHARSLAGENALFGAAQAEQRAGRIARARTLYERYLSRYPQGRLRAEALRGLAATSRK